MAGYVPFEKLNVFLPRQNDKLIPISYMAAKAAKKFGISLGGACRGDTDFVGLKRVFSNEEGLHEVCKDSDYILIFSNKLRVEYNFLRNNYKDALRFMIMSNEKNNCVLNADIQEGIYKHLRGAIYLHTDCRKLGVIGTVTQRENYSENYYRLFCKLFMDTFKYNPIPSSFPRACCGLAEPIRCVCRYAYWCPRHGTQHHGSHD